MTPQTKVLRMALEALESFVQPDSCEHGFWWEDCPNDTCEKVKDMKTITAIKEALSSEAMTSSPNGEAQPEQKQNLKLMPREATREMLEAMDECSMEGYDERLYAGHAASVYMAAWDAFHGQLCYCGDITNLGVIHRDDGPCHYPEHTSEYKRGYADAMNWKVQNHLEHLPPKEPEQEPEDLTIAYMAGLSRGKELASQRKPLTDEEIILIVAECAASHQHTDIHFARAIEAAHGIKE